MKTAEIVSAILAARVISPDAANTMIGSVAKTPVMFTALLADLNDEERGAIVSAIVAAPRWAKVETKPPVDMRPDVAPTTIRERIIADLRVHPKSAAVQIKERIGVASGGGFAAALKVGIDKGEIVCHEPETTGGVKTYSAVSAK